MGINDFKLKWAHSTCLGKPVYVSTSKILVSCEFFMKSFDVVGNLMKNHFKPEFRKGCYCSLPELGLVAVSKCEGNGAIYILRYPEMAEISILEQTSNGIYSAIHFVGLELLLSVRTQKCYVFDLWKWASANKVQSLPIPLEASETPIIQLLVNPLWWHQVMVQSNTRLILVEVKKTDDSYYLDAKSYLFFENKEGEIELYSRNSYNSQRDFQTNVINIKLKTLTILCFCWLPENNVLVATSGGILKFAYEDTTIHKLTENAAGISCMVMSKSSLLVCYETGLIDMVNIKGNHWNIKETITIGQPIIFSFMSPDYSFLTITTLKGYVILQQLGDGWLNSRTLWTVEFAVTVGVAFIGPLAKHCVVAKKNGFLHIFRTADGGIVSTFKIEEEISTMASSPLCCCIVIGSYVGFLYFIDCTNPLTPKIVHCERPYDIPMNNLKFDNYGRFIVASAQNEAIKIWNGLPSSGFTLLGSMKITTQVKDLNIFSKAGADATALLLLTEGESRAEETVGNTLIMLKLPSDFSKSFKKYQTDVFGTLSEDALNFQKRILNNPACKMEIHWKLGAVLYSPINREIQKCHVWADFENFKEMKVLTVENVCDMYIGLNQRWLVVADLSGSVNLYSTNDFNLCGCAEKYTTSEGINKSFVHLPLSSNTLICARENGAILFYEWTEDFSCLQPVPDWIVHCISNFRKENECLCSMEEEEKLDVAPQDTVTNFGSGLILSDIYQDLEMWICVISFTLDLLIDDCDLNYETVPSNFILDDDSLSRFSEENRETVLRSLPEKIKMDAKTEERKGKIKVKTLSSINLGFTTQNYNERDIESDVKLAEILSLLPVNKTSNKKSSLTFSKSVKFKCKEERLSTIKKLIHKICNLKTAFNEEFNALFQKKSTISDSFDEAYFEAKRLSQTLPSKAEKDFWNASVERKYSFSDDWKADHIKNCANQSNKLKTDTAEETKSSIECQVQSARSIQEKFDSDLEVLLLKKKYSDYNISRHETNIYIMLFFSIEEEEFSDWRHETETEIKGLEAIQNEMEILLNELSEAEKNIKDAYSEIHKLDRTSSSIFERKYNLMHKCTEAVIILKKELPMKLDDSSQNPFCLSSGSINIDDFTSMRNDFYLNNLRPSTVNKSDWESVCNKHLRTLNIGIIIRNLQNQALFVTHAKQLCNDSCMKFKEYIVILQKALKSMSALISKFTIKFEALLTILLGSTDFKLVRNGKSKAELSLRTIPDSEHQIWKSIDRESYRIQVVRQHLNETEKLFKQLHKLKLDMYSMVSSVKTEYPVLMNDTKERLNVCKQDFCKAKSAAEEYVDGFKKRVFKIFK